MPSPLTLEHMIWVEEIKPDGSFAAVSSSSTLMPDVSDRIPHSGKVAVSIQSPCGFEAVLWWEDWKFDKDRKWSFLPGDVFVYSAAAGEELVIKPADFHNSVERWVFCRDVRSGILHTPEPMLFRANGNVNIVRTDGTFLWLRTRRERICEYRGHKDDWRRLIDITITTFDHSKI